LESLILLGASFQWVRVFSGCDSSVGATLQWVRLFSGCDSSVGATLQWVRVFNVQCPGCQSSVSASFQCESVLSFGKTVNQDSAGVMRQVRGVMHQLACAQSSIRREIAPLHLRTDFLLSALSIVQTCVVGCKRLRIENICQF
jgi:hypothetical protein